MSTLANIPHAAINLVLTLLIPVILPHAGNNVEAAHSLALAMLTEYQPRTIQELRAAAKAVGLGLNSLQALAEAAEPGLTPARLLALRRWACTLSRAELQAQKSLQDMQRARAAKIPEPPQASTEPQTSPAAPQPAETAANPASANRAPANPAQANPAQANPAQANPAQANPAPDISAEENAYDTAVKLLNLMKSHHKGAPPPNSKAAQQIQAQHRVVETARMKLEQARQRSAATPLQAAA